MLLATSVLLSVGDRQSNFARPLFAISYIAIQQSQRPGTIRVPVNLVPVDVMVTDENGRPVTNLKQEDFRIFEKGKQQEIRHFSMQTLKPESPEPIPALRATGPLDLAPQTRDKKHKLPGHGALPQRDRKDKLPGQ